MTARNNGNTNQIVTKINYDQKFLSIFLKTTNNQIKTASDKIYTQNINRHFVWAKYGSFLHSDLATIRLEMSKRGKIF